MIQDIYASCISCLYTKEDIRDYEEKLLEKCMDDRYTYNVPLGKTVYDEYAPPFATIEMI